MRYFVQAAKHSLRAFPADASRHLHCVINSLKRYCGVVGLQHAHNIKNSGAGIPQIPRPRNNVFTALELEVGDQCFTA